MLHQNSKHGWIFVSAYDVACIVVLVLVVTTQMLLNSKHLDKLVLHNECGLSVSFACNVQSGVKRVVVSYC